jgi:hypothetical protein
MNGCLKCGSSAQAGVMRPPPRSIAARLAGTARKIPVPSVDAARLARVAMARGQGTAASCRPSWTDALSLAWRPALVAFGFALAAVLLLHPFRTPSPPALAVADGMDEETISQLVANTLTWFDQLLGGAALAAEQERLLGDAGRLAAAIAAEVPLLDPASLL